MGNVLTLTKRELSAYFLSPLAYVVMTGLLFFAGLSFYSELSKTANTESIIVVFATLVTITLIIMPMITMRLLSEEKRSGTLEMLMTAPITETQIVLSKFFGGFFFYLFLIVPTFIYVILVMLWGYTDLGIILSRYLGLILMGSSFIAIGLFVSSFTANQIVAAVITFVILIIGVIIGEIAMPIGQTITSFLNTIGSWLFGTIDDKSIIKTLQYLGLFNHFDGFWKGLIDSRDLVFFLSIVVLFLFLTVRVVESKRWK